HPRDPHSFPTRRSSDLRGVAVLIEKPLAKDVFDARKIVEASHKYTAIVQVGHIERFNPAIRAMQQLDIRPRFIEVVRISPLTFRDRKSTRLNSSHLGIS